MSSNLTAKRELVLKTIESLNRPVDAATILNYVKEKARIDRATVFRTINFLLENGKIRKVEFGDGKARYEQMDDHHHLVCNQCGRVEKIDCELNSLVEKITEKKRFKIENHLMEFFGICRLCQL